MELHLQSHHWERRLPDWPAAAVAGFAAGALLMIIEMIWSVVAQGGSPWALPRMIAAIGLGPETARIEGFSVEVLGVSLAIHYALGIAFGLLLAVIIAPFHLDSSAGLVLLVGALFGAAIYGLGFYAMTRAFPWFAEVRGMAMLTMHVIFGMAAAVLYRQFERRGIDLAAR